MHRKAIFFTFLWYIAILASLLSKSLKFCENIDSEKIGENLTNFFQKYNICRLLWKSTEIASNFAKMAQKSWKITEIWNGVKEKMYISSKDFQLVFTCKIWLRYSRERASERVQKMYALKDPVGDRRPGTRVVPLSEWCAYASGQLQRGFLKGGHSQLEDERSEVVER